MGAKRVVNISQAVEVEAEAGPESGSFAAAVQSPDAVEFRPGSSLEQTAVHARWRTALAAEAHRGKMFGSGVFEPGDLGTGARRDVHRLDAWQLWLQSCIGRCGHLRQRWQIMPLPRQPP
jgi:hypothetical protein